MPEFWFIRHGQSETNIGLPSETDQSTPLTNKGIAQANFVAQAINEPPELIVVSPFLRTSQTAEPTCKQFPQVPVETWPIQEFSYLSYAQYSGTITKDRRHLSINYFRKGNPNLILGDGGESFNQFIGRVEQCFQNLKESAHEKVILFGHGWFIRAGLWILLREAESKREHQNLKSQIKQYLHTSALLMGFYTLRKNKSDMQSFLLFSAAVETPNCSVVKFKLIKNTRKLVLSGFDNSHLPDEYQRTTLRNR